MMDMKKDVLGINIDNLTAKEAMKQFVEYMKTEPVSVIELVTADSLMHMEETVDLKEKLSGMELILAGDTAVLETAHMADKRRMKETVEEVFLKMAFRYVCRNHKRVYLLVDSEQEGRESLSYLESQFKGMEIAGMAKVSPKDRADDMLVNAINGTEVDCVLSLLSSPLQEELILENRNLLNAHIWLGIGKKRFPLQKSRKIHEKISAFLLRRLLQKQVEQKKKDERS